MDTDKLNGILEGANIATRKLHKIGDAFFLTGNEVMANKLYDIANLICDIPEDVEELHHKEVMGILDDNNAQLGNIITGIMDRGES